MSKFKGQRLKGSLALVSTLLGACGSGGNINTPPTIQNLQLIDLNGGTIEKTDLIQVQYNFNDQEKDKEESPDIYWERDGQILQTAASRTYKVSASDRGSTIAVKVRPRAKTGNNESIFYEEKISVPIIAANERWKNEILTNSAAEQQNALVGFRGPYGMSVHQNNIYVSDIWDRKVVKFTDNLKFDEWLGLSLPDEKVGWHEYADSGNSQQPVESTPGLLEGPHAVAFGDEGIYVADYFGGKINVFDKNGNFSHYLAEDDERISFKGPANIFIDAGGTLYISDWNDNRIVIFDEFERFVGWIGASNENEDEIKIAGGAVQSNQLGGYFKPHMVTKDSDGNLYIADQGNHRIQKLSPDYKPLGWIGFNSVIDVYTGWRTDLVPEKTNDIRGFDNPVSVEIHNGKLIIVDHGNHRVCRYTLAGIFDGWIGGTNEMPVLNWHYDESIQHINYDNAFFRAPYDAKGLEGSIAVADGHKKHVVILR